MSPGSSIVEAALLAHHLWSLLDGTGGGVIGFAVLVGVELEIAGRRKGSAPLGEAWLFEATVRKGISLNLRYVYTVSQSQHNQLLAVPSIALSAIHTCHFKHAGLKLGAPVLAPSSVVKTYKTFSSLNLGAR